MKRNIYNTAAAVATTLLLLLYLLPACSDDGGGNDIPEVPETKYAKLTITLGSLNNATPAFTRAGDEDGYRENDIIDPNFADAPFEHHIDDWYIIVVKTDGTVDRVVSNNSDVTTAEQSTTEANNNDENSKTEIEMELIVGETYSFYAFANLKGLKNYQTVIGTLGSLKGQPFADFRKTEATLKTLTEYNGETNTSYIPMSSYGRSRIVSETVSANTVELELIRLLGKVSIEVTNATGVDITVNKLTMGLFRTTGNIFLMPYDATETDPGQGKENLMYGTGAENKLMNPLFPEGNSNETAGTDHVFNPNDNKIGTTEDDNQKTYSFYANETAQENQENGTKDMTIAMDVSGQGINKDDSPKLTNFFFLRRNDLLNIPVLISNVDMGGGFEQQHMPIGGLPTPYTFNAGIEIAERTFVTDHAGEIKITYRLNVVNNVTLSDDDPKGWSLKYYVSGDIQRGDRFCYAALEENTKVTSTDSGFLLEPAKDDQDPLTWWTAAVGSDDDKPSCTFKLEKSKKQGTDGQETEDDSLIAGSFTVTVQELATLATAKIKLTLVAQHTDGTEIILPYTFTITNKENTNQEGGGN